MLEVSAYLPHHGAFWLFLPLAVPWRWQMTLPLGTVIQAKQPWFMCPAGWWWLGIPENGGLHSTVLWEGHGEDSLGFPKAHSYCGSLPSPLVLCCWVSSPQDIPQYPFLKKHRFLCSGSQVLSFRAAYGRL